MSGTRTRAALHRSVETDGFSRVPLPVDCTDQEQFPEIARAIRHAKQLKDEINGIGEVL